MNFFELNLNALRRNHPGFLPQLQPGNYPGLEFFPTRQGALSARLGELYLHSRFDPVKEAANLIQSHLEKEISIAIFFGYGLGYHIAAFLAACPRIPVLILEPDIPLFCHVLTASDQQEILKEARVHLHLGEDLSSLPEVIQQLPMGKAQVIKLRSVYSKNSSFYADAHQAIRNFLQNKEVNLNTLSRFGKLWVKNLVNNMERLLMMPGINRLADIFKGIPALILASGPSLDELWPLLPQLRQRMVIITVDTSLKACLERDLEPDFIIVVDPQYWNTRHLDGASPREGFLISESSTHPRVFKQLSLPGFFASSFFPLGKYLESVAGYKGRIGAGGSVATSAWDFARLLGCAPLCLAGMDLAFPDKQTHFKGAYFEQAFHAASCRLQPAETSSFRYLHQGQSHYIPAADGTRVLSDRRMDIYRSWFASQAELFPDLKTHTLSFRGAKLAGITPLEPAELLKLPEVRKDIEAIKQKTRLLCRPAPEEIASGCKQLVSALSSLEADLLELEKTAKQGLRQTASIRRLLKKGRSFRQELANLDRLDEAIRGHSSRIIAGFLIQPVIQKVVNTTQAGHSPTEIIRVNAEIYRELRDSSRYHADLIREARRRLSRQTQGGDR